MGTTNTLSLLLQAEELPLNLASDPVRVSLLQQAMTPVYLKLINEAMMDVVVCFGSVERVEKLGLDDVEITAVERIKPGTEIDGTKAAGGAVLVKARAKPPSKVNIAICLPDDWNGIFLGNGNGGMGQNLS